MIREDYQYYLERVKLALTHFKINYSHLQEDELSAKFTLKPGWILEMEGERHGTGVTLFINNIKINKNNMYAIWLLMRAAKNATGINPGKPTIENQIGFIALNNNSILEHIDLYENEYRKLDETF